MILHPSPYLDTEFQVLNAICKITNRKDYLIFKSENFPGYFDGNKLWMPKDSKLPVEDWKPVFLESFPESRYSHVRIVIEHTEKTAKVISKAKKSGFNSFEKHVFMAVESCQPLIMPQDILIRELKGDKDAEEFYYHQKACHPDNNWFLTEGLEIQKVTTKKLGIRWFGIFYKNNPKLLASLGVFQYGNLARLQDVKTNPHHFRKGLATYLMRFIIQFALTTLRVRELVLCADKNYHAFQFYKRLGFLPKEEITVISKYDI